ncbi:TIGR03943 family putative permease subunit [Streptomyces sp. CA-179760]|uniref:TIGR03943 family putative permease subunit n=1 Tax=Streptomyces sp. CA-179760 TaxID=3240054 RepID=UPI003D8F99BF
MNRLAQSALLFLLGATLLHSGMTDLYLRYVKAGLRPLVLLAGAVLIATAAATLWYDRRGAGHKHQDDDDDDDDGGGDGEHGHDHDHDHHHEPRITWLLTLPVLALILVAPPALGSYSASHTGTALQKPFGFADLPSEGPLRLGVADYAGRAVYGNGRSLRDRELKITGFVTLDRAGSPYLVRMGLNCCAADAQPVKIALTGDVPPVLSPDTWLEITGRYTPRRTKDPVNNGPIPYLEVTMAKPVPTPHDPYDETWNT